MLPLEITAPIIEYGLLAPVLIIFAGACLGVLVEALVPRACAASVQLFSPCCRSLVALATTVLNWATGDRRAGRRRLAGPRRADLLHVDDPADLRRRVVPAVRRAQDRERQPVRPLGRGGTRAPRPSRRRSRSGRAHRGLPAGAVRAVGDDALPGVQRPDHHVRRAGDLVAAALPALRAGPAAPAAVPGGGAEVLPAGRPVLGVLPLRGGPALRLLRLVHLPRDRHRAAQQPAEPRPAAGRDGAAGRRAAVQVRRRAVPLLDPGRLRRRAHPGDRVHGRLHQDRRDRRADAGLLRRPRRATAGTGSR